MNPLSVSDISSYTPIPIPNVSNPGMINFTDKLNQVIKENKLLQKKTKKSFAEIRAAFGSNKKPQRPKMKITTPRIAGINSYITDLRSICFIFKFTYQKYFNNYIL